MEGSRRASTEWRTILGSLGTSSCQRMLSVLANSAWNFEEVMNVSSNLMMSFSLSLLSKPSVSHLPDEEPRELWTYLLGSFPCSPPEFELFPPLLESCESDHAYPAFLNPEGTQPGLEIAPLGNLGYASMAASLHFNGRGCHNCGKGCGHCSSSPCRHERGNPPV